MADGRPPLAGEFLICDYGVPCAGNRNSVNNIRSTCAACAAESDESGGRSGR